MWQCQNLNKLIARLMHLIPLTIFLCFSSTVHGGESYRVLGEVPFTHYNNQEVPTPVAHVENVFDWPNQTMWEYSVTANRGIVNAWQKYSHSISGALTTWASFRFDDVVFSSPGGTGGTAQVSVNFIYFASVADPTCDSANSQAKVTLLLADALQEPWHSVGTWVARGGSCGNPPSDGVFTGYNLEMGINALLTTQTYTVPLDVPVQFQLRSEPVNASASYHDQVIMQSELRLPTGPTPVFNVPAGITVNSVQGNIVNNMWHGIAQNCPADIAPLGPGDGSVGVPDLLLVINRWGEGTGSPAELSGDETVGVPDLLFIINNWGACP